MDPKKEKQKRKEKRKKDAKRLLSALANFVDEDVANLILIDSTKLKSPGKRVKLQVEHEDSAIAQPSKKQKTSSDKQAKKKLESLIDSVLQQYPVSEDITSQIEEAKVGRNVQQFNQIISENGNRQKLSAVLKTFRDMQLAHIRPTVYTFTSLLNACIRCSEFSYADLIFQCMKESNVKPNEVTYTVLLKGETKNFTTLKRALEIFSEMKQVAIHPNIRTYNTLMRVAWKNVSSTVALELHDEMCTAKVKEDSTTFEYLIKTLVMDSKFSQALEKLSKMESLKFFQDSVYVALAVGLGLSGDILQAKQYLSKAKQHSSSTSTANARKSVPLFLSHRDSETKRDYERVSKFLQQNIGRFEKFFECQRVLFHPDIEMDEKYHRVETQLDLPALFGNDKDIHLELCAGHGDWVVERAGKSPDNWVALEIRPERVYQIWSRMVFANLDNLLILGGNAHHLLEKFVAGTVTEVYVNFPEPPTWEGNQQHFFSPRFFDLVHKVLKLGGFITVVTDNTPCYKAITDHFSGTTKFKSAFGDKTHSTTLPQDYGSSYFDRLWNQGNHKSRFFIRYMKS